MIGKIKSCIGGFSLFNYVIDDEKGIELLRNNLCGETPIELIREMQIIQNLNQKATNKLISMVLSPHVDDGEKLSKKQLQNLTKEFLKELEIDVENSQFIAFLHTEKRHRHIHILLNRVDENGKLLKDNHIGKKAQWAAHRVAEKNRLISAKQIRIDKIKEADSIKMDSKILRKEIYQKHLNAMAAKPRTMEKYLSEMMKQGVKFIPIINKQGNLQGFRVRNMETQTEMKASEVHRNMGLKNLLDSGLFFQDKNFDLSNAMEESNQFSIQKVHEESIIAEKRNNNFSANNIFAFSPNIVDHTEDELKRKRKKTFKRR
ncbi:relaxase/mobilization nuclease domain-containing protein [Halpernia frigidisoli]|uniref:Relaxase/Mobilisation nuclease domain-containing protein n=1 Tax=Halpernia frigidisoli TaxID=1125876 RepID=A0A1I3J5C6_9FLAO|nr:relaxase/mobilization nuclease domain-containing protein [Halpernia frigidisoli]SFI55158.1 Relaxase/Mobilisation nuclease domain-containing protein [Halpernia frigidisoli]